MPEPEPLRTATRKALEHVQGYLTLGMRAEAEAEMETIGPDERKHPLVAEAHMAILYAQEDWAGLEEAARDYAEANPADPTGWINLALAVRRTMGVAEAKRVLETVEPLFGGATPVLHYNLACYRCLQGEMEGAKAALGQAIEMDANFKAIASADPDLEPLREYIRDLA
jgi:tetratricopeptide (TPR) repeat protein